MTTMIKNRSMGTKATGKKSNNLDISSLVIFNDFISFLTEKRAQVAKEPPAL